MRLVRLLAARARKRLQEVESLESAKRERVMAVLRGQQPDRVPLYDLLFNDAVIRHFAGRVPATGEAGLATVCEAIGKALDMTRSITAPMEPGEERIDQGELEGFVLKRQRWTCWIERRPFSDVEGAKQFIERSIRLRKAWRPTRDIVDAYREEYERYHELTGGTVVLHHPSPVGIDTAYTQLGWELFSYVMVEQADLLEEWLEAMLEQELGRVEALADAALSPAVLVYSDIASKNGLLISPRFLRRAFVPRLQRQVEAWHARGISCLFHSDGDLSEILQDIVRAGADGLNPLECTERMNVFTAYEQLGEQVYYAGGVDVKILNLRPKGEVEAWVRRMVDTLPAHRLLLGSSTELSQDVPLENFLAVYNIARAVPK